MQRFFASGATRRLADSWACKKPLRLIFALHAVFSGIFHLLIMGQCKSGVRKSSEAVFRKITLRKTVPLRSFALLNFRTP